MLVNQAFLSSCKKQSIKCKTDEMSEHPRKHPRLRELLVALAFASYALQH